eukprot:8789213-Pyramimonas_sp.AAC.1
MDFGRSTLSIPSHWTILHEVIGAITFMAFQDLAVSTSRVPPPTFAFARGFPTAFSATFYLPKNISSY